MNDVEINLVIKNSELMDKYEVINEVIDRKSLRKNSRERGGKFQRGWECGLVVLLLAEQRRGWSGQVPFLLAERAR